MPNPLRPKQHRIVQIHVRRRAVPQRLARMEDKRHLDTNLLLPLHEPPQRRDVVRERAQRVLVPDEVEP